MNSRSRLETQGDRQIDVILSTVLAGGAPLGPRAHPLFPGLPRHANKGEWVADVSDESRTADRPPSSGAS